MIGIRSIVDSCPIGQGFPQQWKYGRRGGLFKISEMAGVNAWGSMWVASKTGKYFVNKLILVNL